MFFRILNARSLLWLVLAVPGVPMAVVLAGGEPGPNGEPAAELLLHPTGEWAARLMIIAMLITPMRMLFPTTRFWGWMVRRRRYFGVAAFAYALAHTVLYVTDMGSLKAMMGEFFALGIWTGWLAFAIFIPLALTSHDYCVRLLGSRRWKQLQRWIYLAAVATLLHWIFVHNNLGPALVHFVPLAGLEAWRIWQNGRKLMLRA